MEFVFIILGVFLLCIFIYLINSYQECFTNYTNKEIKTLSLTEIDKIKTAYEEIKRLYFKGFLVNSLEVNKKKDIIKNSIAKIANLVPNSSDKMNINNIYYGSTSDYGIRKYLNEINDKQFNDIINQLRNLSPNNDARNNEINNIINNYNDIKTLYSRTDNSNIYTSVISKKRAIESAFNNLKSIVSSKSDKQKIDIIYTEISMYLTTPNDAYFLPKLEELKLIAPNSLSDIDNIKSKYEDIKKINNSSSPEAIKLKDDINKIILDIRNRAGDKSDIDKLDLIYYGEAKDNYGLIVYLDEIDENRFEQELIYYIEKLDITEEKTRLKTHCNFFLENIKEASTGRKLAFISQEIGREINTIGSKANNAPIQKIVVLMKDELEKIKEQLNNIL